PWLLVGCPSATCDSPTPCQDALILGLPGAGAGDYTLSMELDGQPESCDITLDGAGSGSKTCSSEALDVGTLDGAIWAYVYGTPSQVDIHLEFGGQTLFERSVSPEYQDLSKDSQNCVSCRQAELDYTAE
ncbi:MAG: hypothetical protein KC492_31865, partial [Myxococcales bacterium]|nr:hypothetical protein [Myxococcales bacterium]